MQVREASIAHTAAIARVRIDTWRAAYAGIVPAEYLANLSYERSEQQWRSILWEKREPGVFSFVAEDLDHQIIGIAIGGPELEQDPEYRGGIYVLYVLPTCQRRGAGRRLVASCADNLLRQNIETMLVWVLALNPARAFYDRLGGIPVRTKQVEIGGATFEEVGYGWTDIRPLASIPNSHSVT
jgi:GNAT superfamily N-acetyltransferase